MILWKIMVNYPLIFNKYLDYLFLCFQMLAVLKASVSEDPPSTFIRQLIDAIKDRGNMLAVMEIEQKIKDWWVMRYIKMMHTYGYLQIFDYI